MPRRATRPDEYEREYEAPRRESGLRQLVILLAVAFMVTLGVVVGARLSSDAIAVLVGVIAGVAASIPCALLLLAVTRRREQQAQSRQAHPPERQARWMDYHEPRPAQPPVIVVTPGSSPQQVAPWTSGKGDWQSAPGYQAGGYPPPASAQRQFRVMGYDEQEDE